MTILVYILIGLAVGSVSGAFGIGGGVLMVPALMWLCELDARKATGTSLAVIVPACLPASLVAYRKQHVEVEAALWIAAAFVVGALASRLWLEYLPDRAMRMLFGLLMAYIAVRFVISSDSDAANAFAGLVGVGLAWLTFWRLRALGRQHLEKPQLAEQIQRAQTAGHGEPDYYI
jgi:uncharacterized membrane protein YfcA